MKKGRIKIKKNGTASINRTIAVPKLFDLSDFTPETGSVTYDCEFEVNENNLASKIIIEGTIIGENIEIKKQQEEKQKREAERKQAEEKRKKELKENQALIDYLKDDFVDMSKTFLPEDTIKVLQPIKWKIDNFSLKLNKAARFEGDKFSFFKTDKGKIIYKPKYKFSENLISEICNKNLKSAENLMGKNNLIIKKLESNWRMIVGLGGESVYETSITLHHIYGIPYIPASSIKGVVRSYIIQEVFGEKAVPEEEKDFPLVNAEYRALKNEDFCKIFGCPKDIKKVRFGDNKPVYKDEKKKKYDYHTKEKTGLGEENIGSITFFDAFPIEKPSIEPDVMNVHYPDYYGKDNVPPTDYQNPNPIFFLTVKDTKFQFIVGSKKEKLDSLKIADRTIDWWLKEALENQGIGAKTAVGYGRMK